MPVNAEPSPENDVAATVPTTCNALVGLQARPGELSVWLRLTIVLALPEWSKLIKAGVWGAGYNDATLATFADHIVECATAAEIALTI